MKIREGELRIFRNHGVVGIGEGASVRPTIITRELAFDIKAYKEDKRGEVPHSLVKKLARAYIVDQARRPEPDQALHKSKERKKILAQATKKVKEEFGIPPSTCSNGMLCEIGSGHHEFLNMVTKMTNGGEPEISSHIKRALKALKEDPLERYESIVRQSILAPSEAPSINSKPVSDNGKRQTTLEEVSTSSQKPQLRVVEEHD